MKDQQDTPPRTGTVTPRATYATPRLVVYGSLGDITRNVGATSNMDGGAVTNKMMSQK